MGGIKMKKEYWKPVVGYEGLYEVSNWGRVKSLDRWKSSKNNSKTFIKGRILKPANDGQGYLQVVLYKNGYKKTFKVHRLVAEAFIPNSDNLPEVNHKDEQKDNNIYTNLEWCDRKYNVNYGTGLKRMSEKLSKPVLQYTLDGELVKEWSSARECDRNGFCSQHVAACCRGELKHHKGFIWKYK